MNWTKKVVLDGESSDDLSVDSGVAQGTVLGPLLFLCHINDLFDCIKGHSQILIRQSMIDSLYPSVVLYEHFMWVKGQVWIGLKE